MRIVIRRITTTDGTVVDVENFGPDSVDLVLDGEPLTVLSGQEREINIPWRNSMPISIVEPDGTELRLPS